MIESSKFEQCLLLPGLPQIKASPRAMTSVLWVFLIQMVWVRMKFGINTNATSIVVWISWDELFTIHATIQMVFFSRISLPLVVLLFNIIHTFINKPFNVHCNIRERGTGCFMDWNAFCTDGRTVWQLIKLMLLE